MRRFFRTIEGNLNGTNEKVRPKATPLSSFKSVDLASLFTTGADPLQICAVLPTPRPAPRPQTPSADTKGLARVQAETAVTAPSRQIDRLALYTSQQRMFSGFQNELHAILEQMRTSQRTLQTIGFAGADAGAGVSTICSSLAALSAEMEKSLTWVKSKTDPNMPQAYAKPHTVLLIDAQLHHPSIHSLFGVAPAPGLAAVLAGSPISRCVQRVLPHLHILACGDFKRTYLTQTEWIKLAAIIKEAQHLYSHIFIDLPALAPYPSGIDLARLCQAVTLVVSANKTRRHSLQHARALLEKNRIPILGGILNRQEAFAPAWLDRRM